MAVSTERPVLIIDDNYHITHGLSILLGKYGLTCITKNEAKGILDIIDETHPRVIVTVRSRRTEGKNRKLLFLRRALRAPPEGGVVDGLAHFLFVNGNAVPAHRF